MQSRLLDRIELYKPEFINWKRIMKTGSKDRISPVFFVEEMKRLGFSLMTNVISVRTVLTTLLLFPSRKSMKSRGVSIYRTKKQDESH